MSYPALPDRRMPYDNDGTVVGYGTLGAGLEVYPTGSQLLVLNGITYGDAGQSSENANATIFVFFPEQREVTARYAWVYYAASGNPAPTTPNVITGSNDTTNGLDGTWETASLGGANTKDDDYCWRSTIGSISFTGGKHTIRLTKTGFSAGIQHPMMMHLYGEKVAGQTPDDILFLDGENAYAEFTVADDFGDRPLGTTVSRTFKVKNASTTKTANSINLQCNDADFAMSENGTTWVTTINISSLAPGASSSALYVRNTTPDPGNLLGPRFARIVCTVGSWT